MTPPSSFRAAVSDQALNRPELLVVLSVFAAMSTFLLLVCVALFISRHRLSSRSNFGESVHSAIRGPFQPPSPPLSSGRRLLNLL